MNNFLNQVCKHFCKKIPNLSYELDKYAFVFPNKRAGLFFTQTLKENFKNKIIFLPKIFSINEFFEYLSKYTIAQEIELLANLYITYSKIYNKTETFDEFYYWGKLILNDFNDIDKYLADPEKIFKTVKNYKDIEQTFNSNDDYNKILKEFWGIILNENNNKKSSIKKEFIYIWEKLPELYKKFKENLKNKGIAYEGMLIREIIDNINEDYFKEFEKIIFVGFNALNKCEEKLFTFLQEQNKALFYWDVDKFYIETEKEHEAGYFLRENLNKYPNAIERTNELLKKDKKINVISCNLNTEQSKLLSKKLLSKESTEIAIVLTDESILPSVLYSMPDKIGEFNVTMGYPIRNTSLRSFVEYFMDFLLSLNNKELNEKIFKNFISQPYTSLFINSYESDICNINNIKQLFPDEIKLEGFLNNNSNNKYIEFLNLIIKTLEIIFVKLKSSIQNNKIECEYIFKFNEELTALLKTLSKIQLNLGTDAENSCKIISKLIRNILKSIRIPFEGDPISPVQIMGLLETRCLDFKTTYILNANDSNIPGKSHLHSFIPYRIRKAFQLPLLEHRDAIYAYYFYRIIQHSQEINIFYINAKDDKGTLLEKSRFVQQLIYEDYFKVNQEIYTSNINLRTNPKISIDINQNNVKNKIKEFLQRSEGISPSHITSFLDCNLKFYLQNILCIKSEIEADDINNRIIGDLFHEIMEKIYSDYVNKILTEDKIKDIINDINDINGKIIKIINKCADEYFKKNKLLSASKRNLAKEVLKMYISAMLKKDMEYAPFKILSLEEIYFCPYNKYKLSGKIDRIDQKNNTIRIIDYKTGKVENEVNKNQILNIDKNNSEATQIFLYTYIYYNSQKPKNNSQKIEPHLISLRHIHNKNDFAVINKENKQIFQIHEINDTIETKLNNVFNSMLNKNYESIWYDNKKCDYCKFFSLCNAKFFITKQNKSQNYDATLASK